jgi:hypothetical protein
MTTELTNEHKRRELLAMLDRGPGLVMVHLDPRVGGVHVPPGLAADPVLRLNLAYGFNLPALDVGADGVYAVLSFSGRDFGCTLPWRAIFALTMPGEDHEGVVWPADVPPELRPFFDQAGVGAGAVPVSLRAVRQGAEAPPQAVPAPAAPPPKPAKPRLSVVPVASEPTGEHAAPQSAGGGPPRDRPSGPPVALVPPSGRPTLELVRE